MGADLCIPACILHQAAQMAEDMSQTHSHYNFSFTTVTVSPIYVLGFFLSNKKLTVHILNMWLKKKFAPVFLEI